MAATILGAIGPCFTGPIWEELLYRGFLLQALAMFMSLSTAVDVRARKVAFPPHHARHITLINPDKPPRILFRHLHAHAP